MGGDYVTLNQLVTAFNRTGSYWLPKVNETVACLYLPTFNGDGVILGAIKT